MRSLVERNESNWYFGLVAIRFLLHAGQPACHFIVNLGLESSVQDSIFAVRLWLLLIIEFMIYRCYCSLSIKVALIQIPLFLGKEIALWTILSRY